MFETSLAVRGRGFLAENSLLLSVMALTAAVVIAKTDGDLYASTIFCSCAAVFLILRGFLGNTLSIKYLTLPSFFMLCYFIVLSIPSIWTFTDLRHPIRYTYFLAIQSVLTTFPLGVSLANFFFKYPSKIIQDYAHSRLGIAGEDFKFVPVFIVLTLSVGPLLLPYFMLAPHIQLFEVLKSYPTSIDPVSLRFAEYDVPKLAQYCFEIARRFVLPICALYAYLMSRVYQGKWAFTFWVLFSGTLVISSLTLDRAEPVTFLIMMILAYVLARQRTVAWAVRNPKLVMVFALSVALGGIISVSQYQSMFTLRTVFDDMWHVLSYRFFQSPAFMASLAFTTFDDPSSFAHGRYERIFSLLPGFDYIGWDDPRHGAAIAPSTFVGNLWGNWGWPGVILGTTLIGFVYQLIQLTIFRGKSVPNLALYVVMLCDAVWIIYGRALGTMSVSVLLFGLLLALFPGVRGRRRQIKVDSRLLDARCQISRM